MYTNIRTEFSFKQVLGRVDQVAALLAARGVKSACISDFNNTFGHYPWLHACKKVGIKPVYGVTLNVVGSPEEKTKQPTNPMPLIALNDNGLQELYGLVKIAYDHFYYIPRLGYEHINGISSDVVILSGTWPDFGALQGVNYYSQLTPNYCPGEGLFCAALDNFYPTLEDKTLWQLFADKRVEGPNQHILTKEEFNYAGDSAQYGQGIIELAIKNAEAILNEANVSLKAAPMVEYSFPNVWGRDKQIKCRKHKTNSLLEMCIQSPLFDAAWGGTEYDPRLEKELAMIQEKGFEDYFLIVADLVNWAKAQGIFVGPSRGSSAGSLVCYLIGITEVDPLHHGLIFERFIDVTRADLPDIDIDFPDDRRDEVIQYLIDKYGSANVAKLGTVSRMKPRSAIGEFAKAMNIPPWETKELKEALIERPEGDVRSAQCLEDTFETEVGKKFIEKYPAMLLSQQIEDHARHSGVHAAGIVVCPNPLSFYCGVDSRKNVAMLDKKNAENDAGLLKIDILGLTTLSILQDVLTDLDKQSDWLYQLPLNDSTTFETLNKGKMAGLFQFQGEALQSLCHHMTLDTFDDIVAITSLARPGPLASGGAMTFANRKMGRSTIEYLPGSEDITKSTYGVIVYQEQVMRIVREVGKLSWADTSKVRKAMAKSLGEEAVNEYWEEFKKGGLPLKDAQLVWDNILTFGGYGYNKSHAVSYGLISYWTAYLKTHHPSEFTVACLNHLKDEGQGIKILREFVELGFDYVDVDVDISTDKWRVSNNIAYGPLTAIKGIGPKMCEDIMNRRANDQELKPGQKKKLDNPETIYRELWPARANYQNYYDHPEEYGIQNHAVNFIEDLQGLGGYVFVGRLMDRNLKDHNEYGNVIKRGYKMTGPTLFLNMTIEDDTGSIVCTIPRRLFERLGRSIAESAELGKDWYLIKGRIKDDWRRIYIENIRRITVEPAQNE